MTYGYQLGFLTQVGQTMVQGNYSAAWRIVTEYAPSGQWRKLSRPNGTTDE